MSLFYRIALVLLGVLFVLPYVKHLRRGKETMMGLVWLFLSLIGVCSISCGCFPILVDYCEAFSYMSKIRIVFGLFSLMVLLFTFESIRLTQIKEKYALLWLLPCVVILFLTIFSTPIVWLKGKFGMEFSSTMVAVVFGAMLVAIYVLSASISNLEKKLARLAQEVALLDAQIKKSSKETHN